VLDRRRFIKAPKNGLVRSLNGRHLRRRKIVYLERRGEKNRNVRLIPSYRLIPEGLRPDNAFFDRLPAAAPDADLSRGCPSPALPCSPVPEGLIMAVPIGGAFRGSTSIRKRNRQGSRPGSKSSFGGADRGSSTKNRGALQPGGATRRGAQGRTVRGGALNRRGRKRGRSGGQSQKWSGRQIIERWWADHQWWAARAARGRGALPVVFCGAWRKA
jgi:hypothetical protein